MITPRHLKFAANATGRNKDWDFKKLAKNFRDKKGTIDDVISHVKAGHALCAGNLGGKWRAKSNVVGSQWVLLDIDNSGKDANGEKCYEHQLTLDEALQHPFIKQYCALIYTTASHKTDWHKFRLVFLLPEFVPGYEIVEVLTRYLMKHLPHDPACKDASRVFYGSTEASFPLVQPNVTLPAEWVTEAIATAEREKLEYQKRIADIEKRKAELRDRAEFEGWDTDALIQQALSYIPPRQPGSGNYDECLKVLMALNSYYGAAEGQAIAERWSPSIKGTTWNVAAKFRSFRERNGISIGTLFHIAKQYGFKFPQNQQQFESEPKAYNQDGKLEKTVTREKWKTAYTFKQLLDLAPKLKQRFTKKKQPWGFGEQPEEKQQQPQTTPIHIYEKGDRVSTWINSPSKYIFDSSGTGSGKSFDAGRLQPSDFDCEKIFYISNDSRNPTTPTLQKDWAHLEGRHKGLNRDDKDKLRRKKDGGKGAAIPPNCARVDTIAALSTANIQSAYSANVACNNCAYLEACKGGHLFGYLNDRAKAFSNSRIISHPQSLPSPNEDFDYSDSVLIWEEWSEVLKNFDEVRITVRDVDMMIATLATDNFELLQQLQPLLTKIKSLLTKREKAPTRYGWSNENLHQLLKVPDIDLVKLAEATIPNLDALNPTNEHGVDITDLPAGVRKRFQQFDNETANKVHQTVLKQWILPLLKILKGDCTGYISCDFNNLTITTPNSRLAEIAASAKKNIFLDATGRLIDLAQLLIIPHTQIFSCKQKADDTPTNLEVIQVTGLGRMGISRGEDQQRRGEAVIAEITKQCEEKGESCEVISFKKNGSKYQWFVDSRGSNDLEGIQNVVLDGVPTPNLEALKAEFTCIYSRTPIDGTKAVKQPIKVNNPLPEGVYRHFEYEVSIDDDFADFIRQRILEAIKQAIGRNRSERYPDKQFKVYILGDYPLDTPVKLVQAKNITPNAATKLERMQLAIKNADEQLKKKGEKLTQSAIAKLCNVSQQRISQLREFLLILLKGTIYTKTSKNNSPPNAPPDGDWVAQEFIPLVVAEGENSIVNEVISLLNVYSPSELLQIWELVAPKVQIDLLSVLLGTIPEALIRYEGG